MRKKLWRAPAPYPNQSPGSAYCNEREERAERFERLQDRPKTVKKPIEKAPETTQTSAPNSEFYCWRCGNEGPKEDFIMTSKVNPNERTKWACKTGIGCFSYDAI